MIFQALGRVGARCWASHYPLAWTATSDWAHAGSFRVAGSKDRQNLGLIGGFEGLNAAAPAL